MTPIEALLAPVEIPRFFPVRQHFPQGHIPAESIPSHLKQLLEQKGMTTKLRPGQRIAITASSRGIANAAVIMRSLVTLCQAQGALPFLVPAMGSHGGATAKGQREILADYGITEETMGCPIDDRMDTICVGHTEQGQPVYVAKSVMEADGCLVFGRVKTHTAFHGRFESGLMKMLAIGLGKQEGADACHAGGFGEMEENILRFGRVVLREAKPLFAVAVLENAHEETLRFAALAPWEIEEKEPALLREAKAVMGKILLPSCDVLIVDELGKNYSGDGMDPNVTGTFTTPYATGGLQSQRVCVLRLSRETHGNALGIGAAHVTTRKVFEALNFATMYPNILISKTLEAVRIPCVMESDRDAIRAALKTCEGIGTREAKLIRISNSLHLGDILLSEAFWAEAAAHPALEIMGEPQPLRFDEEGNLPGV